MKLLFATGNKMKYELMKERLKELDEIEVVIPKMLNININVVEDGKTPEENAIKKAKEYYKVAKIPTIAEDSGLYIDEFLDNEQPGLFVKRINGVEGLSDEEVLNYYINKLNEHGGKSLAAYNTGVCLIDEDGNVYSKLLKETKFLLTSEVSDTSKCISGGILDCISYDLEAKKYFTDCTKEDKKKHYENLDIEYRDIVKKYILKK